MKPKLFTVNFIQVLIFIKKKLLFIVFLFLMSYSSFSQKLVLDSSFANHGTAYAIFPYPYNPWFTIGSIHGTQSDGKIISSQTTETGNGLQYYSFFERYKIDGTLDSSFGVNGQVLLDGVHKSVIIRKAIVLPNDKILAVIDGSSFESYNGDPESLDFICIRLNANGSFDNSFGKLGIVQTDIHFENTDSYDASGSIAVDSSGNIIVSGSAINRTCSINCYTLAAVRYKNDGTLDSSFASNGIFMQNIFPGFSGSSTFFTEIRPDGKILMDVGNGYGIVQLSNNGVIDSSFGVDGVIEGQSGYFAHEEFHDPKINSDGSFYICSTFRQIIISGTDSAYIKLQICKFKSNGVADSTFAENGRLSVVNNNARLINFHSLAIQKDGKFIVAIDSAKRRNIDYLERFNTNGTLDSSFGNAGKILTYSSDGDKLFVLEIEVNNFYTSNLLIDDSQKLLFQGTYPVSFITDNTAINRYSNESVLATNFLNFSTQLQNNNALLKWQAASEINSNYFNIQRSKNGLQFSTIGKKYAINSSRTNDYTYIDDDVNKLNVSKLYYRLQEIDNDGTSNYSSIKTIDFERAYSLFSISPNPAKDFINLISSVDVTDAQINITDVSGKILLSNKQNFVAGQQLKISISEFPHEVLFVIIINEENREQFKIIKE